MTTIGELTCYTEQADWVFNVILPWLAGVFIGAGLGMLRR